MKTKNILIPLIVLVLVAFVYWYATSRKENISQSNNQQTPVTNEALDNGRVATPTATDEPAIDGKLKVGNFSGKLEKVDVGCFADGECYVVVDGKHVTTTMGWSRDTVGSVKGVEGFGDLEKHIGEEVEVYAQDKGDGTYTLYGSEGFYVKLK